MRNYLKTAKAVCRLLLIVCTLHTGSVFGQNDEVKTFKKHTAPVKAVALSGDDKILATGGDDKMIYLWDLSSGDMINAFANEGPVKSMLFTPDGNILASCGKEMKLMDISGKLIRSYKGYTTEIWSLSYNKPTQRIAAGSYAKYIKVWDYLTGEIAYTLEGHERSCLPVAISPSGNLIASGSLDKSVRIWDAQSGEQLHKMQIHSENIFAVNFHPSVRYFASASADKTIRLWDADSGKVVRTFVGHKGAVFDVQFSEDGSHMLSCDADKVIILWETATGRKIYVFAGHAASVTAVRFTHDGKGFVSASDDQTVRYWPFDKKVFLSGTYFEEEIEKEVAGSPLFKPREDGEDKQSYLDRVEKANRYLDDLYAKYYVQYIEMLHKTPIQ